jgi:hypothetical protein
MTMQRMMALMLALAVLAAAGCSQRSAPPAKDSSKAGAAPQATGTEAAPAETAASTETPPPPADAAGLTAAYHKLEDQLAEKDKELAQFKGQQGTVEARVAEATRAISMQLIKRENEAGLLRGQVGALQGKVAELSKTGPAGAGADAERVRQLTIMNRELEQKNMALVKDLENLKANLAVLQKQLEAAQPK